ncbi:MAG: tRNA 2-thiouridine(34) synthase MnmA, partial [Clostridia bacterium]|nr:tRNA 2-thiouridine(34) synthase MnmA [Clostridia bacterium]
SGGVDSAAAALLLQKEGYDINGVTMRLFSESAENEALDENSVQAKAIADKLGFSHFSVDLSSCFNESVILPFIEDYKNGKTPNPCVECNKKLKFGKLFDITEKEGFDFLATGHYAKIEKDINGEFLLKKATDEKKDQSYFLWSLKKEILPRILLPLGNFTKDEIRAIARENGFSNADRGDSQDICFIPDGDYTAFLEKSGAVEFKPGNFIDLKGNILGVHNGIERYTIGQRKGLGIALGKPTFVCEKNVADNTVTLCDDIELYKKELSASKLNLLITGTLEKEVRLQAKIRYRHTPASAIVRQINENTVSVIFDEPQRAITKGQSLVLYDGDTVIGGGIID